MYEIPIFPLGTVLFPGMPLHLQIFEERYKIMLQKVLSTNRTFGVCLIRRGEEALGPLPEPYKIGCTARVVSVNVKEDGVIQLTAVGDERFRILHLAAVQPYLTGFVESLPLEHPNSIEISRGAQVLRRRLASYLSLMAQLTAEDEGDEDMEVSAQLASMQLPDDPLTLIYLSAALLQIPAHEKQPLLEAETGHHMLHLAHRIYRRELALMPDVLSISSAHANALALMN